MSELAQKHCIPCAGGVSALSQEAQKGLLGDLSSGWKISSGHHLEREFSFPDFRQALTLTNAVGELAEAEGHHPDIYLSWGKVKIVLFTHAIGGLSEGDFILAAKIDTL